MWRNSMTEISSRRYLKPILSNQNISNYHNFSLKRFRPHICSLQKLKLAFLIVVKFLLIVLLIVLGISVTTLGNLYKLLATNYQIISYFLGNFIKIFPNLVTLFGGLWFESRHRYKLLNLLFCFRSKWSDVKSLIVLFFKCRLRLKVVGTFLFRWSVVQSSHGFTLQLLK